MGGFLGFFARDGVEMTGFIPNTYGKNFSGLQGQVYGGPPNIGIPGSQTGTGIPASPPAKAPVALNFEEEKKKILAAAGKDPTLQLVLSEVRNLNEKMDAASTQTEEHPSLKKLAELLRINDFTPSYSSKLLDRARKECSLETLDDFDALQDLALRWIGEGILIFNEGPPQKPRVFVLIGPTGVGKTTTIAKLAAIFGIGNQAENRLEVRMITIDAFRIGARAQIEAYGEIMGFPVSYVDNQADLKKTIALYSDADLVLVDTIGKSPRDSAKLGEMKELLDACGRRAEVHLAITATTKSSDLEEILRQFEPFNYQSVIITKLDETIRMGNVISALSEKGKAVSYITDGQKVPNDIQKADTIRFLINLEGFRIDREKIEEWFPVDEAEHIQWR
jgi:flagellar biosynthesis protein FlhF